PRRLQHRAAARGSPADKTAERDAIGAFRLPHPGSERESDSCCVGALPQDCKGGVGIVGWAKARPCAMPTIYPRLLQQWWARFLLRSASSGRSFAHPHMGPLESSILIGAWVLF